LNVRNTNGKKKVTIQITTLFLRQFDENGNFIELPKEIIETPKTMDSSAQPSIKQLAAKDSRTVKIVYSFKKNAKDKTD
jgi:hypothetical protein